MGKMNWGRIILGGLVAGLVFNVIDYLLNGVVLVADWNSAMTHLNRVKTNPAGDMALLVVMDFVLGLAAIWLYAAIRPRFKPGPRTALIAGLGLWVMSYLASALENQAFHLYTARLDLSVLGVGLVAALVATLVGAWLYKEA
jgi:hypothetical protein